MQHADVIERKIDELRPRFLLMLSSRLDRFEEIRDRLTATEDPTALLDELRLGAHRIVGLAATLGFSDLGALAHEVEVAILPDGGAVRHGPPAPDLLDLIDDFLGEIALLVG